MDKYLLFMDVSGDVDKQFAVDGTVKLLPMDFIIDGEPQSYTDDETGLDVKQFYDIVRTKKPISTTQITPALYAEFFEPYLKDGYSALYLCLSSGLSSSFNSACMAADELNAKYKAQLLPVDSIRATGALGLLCERMIANKNAGKDLRENYYDLETFKHRIDACAYVDDLDSLKRGGRISKTVAFVGGLLGIKPLITFTDNGKLEMWGKQRGTKLSINKMVEFYLAEADTETDNLVYITHADEDRYAQELADKIKEVAPRVVIKTRLLSPIIGAHLGPGAMVLSFVTKPQQ